MSTRRHVPAPAYPAPAESGRPRCRWCRAEVTGRRRTWCGPDCVHEYLVRADAAYARDIVEHRDRGICRLCGIDVHELRRWWWWSRGHASVIENVTDGRTGRPMLREWHRGHHGEPVDPGAREAFGLAVAPWCRAGGGPAFDVDHVVPVVEGGGECGPENLRLLCLPCHRRVTAELAARRAERRRAERPEPAPEPAETTAQLSIGGVR